MISKAANRVHRYINICKKYNIEYNLVSPSILFVDHYFFIYTNIIRIQYIGKEEERPDLKAITKLIRNRR